MNDFARFMIDGSEAQLSGYLEPDVNRKILRVYRNGYLKSCIAALESNYPVLATMLGEARFGALARYYVDKYPPTESSFSMYGEDIVEAINERGDLSNIPYAMDVANLECAWRACYFAADGLAINPYHMMEGVGSDELLALSFSLTPWTKVIVTRYRVADKWAAARKNMLDLNLGKVRAEQEYVVLWRNNDGVLYRCLEAAEKVFISSLVSGINLGDAAEAALKVDSHFDLEHRFASIIQEQLFQLTEDNDHVG